VEFEFQAQNPGQRLDLALVERGVAESRASVQKLILAGAVLVDGIRAMKPGQRLALGAKVSVTIVQETYEVLPQKLPLDLYYEDQNLLVLNKPRGQVVHPAVGHNRGTVVNALLAHTTLSSIGLPERPGIVHRLDKDTSGLMVVAKTDQAHLKLVEMIAKRDFLRQYLALVHGKLENYRGVIRAPLGRDPGNRKRFRVLPGGKEAITHFQVLEEYGDYSFVQLRLKTGRTHQIRVHLAWLGHPLVGDPLYGPKRPHFKDLISGQALHAQRLGFIHPITGEDLDFEAPLPEDMNAIIELLDSGSTV
jgi:23S rRNA pseudouridine1911/1915/1917 synthase